jgi:long-chain acyl-CoA synthetase
MTETSPASFMTSVEDGVSEKLSTVGKILPHTSAKVVDTHGQVVPRGVPGELWVSGYNVQVGYFNEPHKTRDTVVKDDAGTVWIKTGDEVFLDENGYCHITGRIKDVIIRGTFCSIFVPLAFKDGTTCLLAVPPSHRW